MINFRHNSRPAFTLMEVIVVLFVVSVGLVSLLGLIVQNIQSQVYNRNNLIAYQLAQEGIELVRKTRDSNWRAATSTFSGLADGRYYMDYADSAPQVALSDDDVILKQDEDGFYFHDAASPEPASGFSREILLTALDEHSLKVEADVFWSEHQRAYSYSLETILYDWR